MAGRHCVWGGRAGGGGVNSAEISDTWTGEVTFVVNQPLAHLHLPLSGCDKHVSLSPVTALRMGGCVKSALQTCPRSLRWKWTRERPHLAAPTMRGTATFSLPAQSDLWFHINTEKVATFFTFCVRVRGCACTHTNSSGVPFCFARSSVRRCNVTRF